MYTRLLVFIVAVTFLALPACGGDGESKPSGAPTSAPVSHAEDDAAKKLLLTVSDFPTGWAEDKSAADDDSGPLAKCDVQAPGRTGKAESGNFSRASSSSNLSHTVVIYETPEQAAGSMAATRERYDCVVRLINAGNLNDKDAKYKEASVSDVSFTKTGDETGAYRIKMTIEPTKANIFGSSAGATAYLDVVLVRKGRYAYSIATQEIISPFDSSRIEDAVRKAYAKLP